MSLDLLVLFLPINNLPLPSVPALSQLLLARLGGSEENWIIKRVRQGLLVRMPEWISLEDFIYDDQYWESHYITPRSWHCLDQSRPLPPCRRITITIRGFPPNYFHPYYFRLAVTGMGTMVAVTTECLQGNMSYVRLILDTPDLNLIPYYLYVGHEGRWTHCVVELEGRQPPTDRNFPAPPVPPQAPTSVSLSASPTPLTHPPRVVSGSRAQPPEEAQMGSAALPWALSVERPIKTTLGL